MSRTVGPYRDVATARVEGAYELCEGQDENGRPVQILTLGSTSSKDPARRGLLSDTVAWAYATAGPEDAPILVADLEAEQPYVVVLRDARLRGADRIMDRLLALGPATGPLPVGPAAAAQRAAHQLAAAQRSAAPASPSGPPSPPMSPPVIMIAPPKKRSQLKPILIGIGSVVVILALVVGFWVLLSGGDADEPDGSVAEDTGSAALDEDAGQPTEGAEAEEGDRTPHWDAEAPSERVGGTVFDENADTQVIAYENWPFAFKVPAGYACVQDGQSAVCTAGESDSAITVGWEECRGECPEAAREAMREALPYQPLSNLGNGDIGLAERTEVYGRWRGSMSVFVTSSDGAFHAFTSADVETDRTEETWQVFNDVLNQAMARTEAS
ncbi:hypothetical protein [Glycomyces harbinensis]|uniref:Uncharacterized protein n=1 Tax=Glycomyces harbinensis TaxID=58114 RepID=A0A1G6VQF7_9ACTN|nr:hypothetical protein [Glycomyces harbinensis]SDD55779.1 hypothetical protein SAMN05216270_10575 [Glycomyces harbinensis]